MSTSLTIVNQSGKSVGTFEVPDAWLEREKGLQAVTDAAVAYRAAGRAGTAATKTRGKVAGSNAKPWRQKGTGRARSGRRTSPIWRGGGTIFGPQPRSYAKKINKKVRRLAMRRILAERIDEGSVILLDDLTPDAPKTKGVISILEAIGAGQDVLIIGGAGALNENLVLGARNLPMVNLLTVDGVSVYHMMLHPKVVLTRQSLEELGSRIAQSEKTAVAAVEAPVAAEPVAEEAPVVEEAPVEEAAAAVAEEAVVEAVAEEAVAEEAPVAEEAAEEEVAEEVAEQANIETMVIDVTEHAEEDSAEAEETK
jgi:large subunit ribosomal protein L4